MIIAAIIAITLSVEAVALVKLYKDVAGYQKYWTKSNQNSGEFVYLALGDSAAQGLGASKPDNGYVGLIAKRINQKTSKQVRTINLSKSGAVIRDAIDQQLPMIKDIKPDLVTIEIGANDITSFDADNFKSDFRQLSALLPDGSLVSNMPYFSSRPWRRASAYKASEIVKEIVQADNRLVFVDLQSVTRQNSSIFGFAADFFHPNDRAYKNWADAFWEEIQL